MLSHKVFFDNVRGSLFKGQMTATQVDGMDTILREWQSRKNVDLRHLAYMLATTFHETAFKMQPIKEYGGDAYFTRMYDPAGSRPKVAKTLGNTQRGDGAKFAGRGFVQLTGRDNYARAGAKLGMDFVNNPDAVMKAPYAAHIMFNGMEEGWFTGKKLSDYFNARTSDAYNARRIINGTDKANEIAAYYSKFQNALMKAAQAGPGLPTATPLIVPGQDPAVSPFPTAQPGFPNILGGLFDIFLKSNQGTNALPDGKPASQSNTLQTILLTVITAVMTKFIPFAAFLPPGIAEAAANYGAEVIGAIGLAVIAKLRLTQTTPIAGSPLAESIKLAKADVREAEKDAAVEVKIAPIVEAPMAVPEPAFVPATDPTDLVEIERLLRDARKARRRMNALLAELPDEEAPDVVRQ